MSTRVYLETSFVSACVTDRDDASSVYRRQVSLDWWQTQAKRYRLVVSAEVLGELAAPEFRRSREALDLIKEVPVLEITEEVQGFAALLVREKTMPGPVAGDALHLAVAAVHGVDYLLSWNVKHLANPNKVAHLRQVALRVGVAVPQIVTPDLLWEPDDE